MKLMLAILQSVAWSLLVLSIAACAEQEESSKNTADKKITDYEQARAIFWQQLYPNGGDTLYCGRPFLPRARKNFNIEHVFPMSWVTNGLNCGKRKQCRSTSAQFNIIEADLHNLYPSRTDVNRARGSLKFGEVTGEARRYGRKCDFEVNSNSRIVEPRPEVRGDIARSMFYMANEYREQGLELFKNQANLLAQWNRLDPPSAQEKRRNDRIEKIQGNRNPFIDKPEGIDDLVRSWF